MTNAPPPGAPEGGALSVFSSNLEATDDCVSNIRGLG